MSNLEIFSEQQENEILIRCKGRLDANHTGHLNDAIDQFIRDGHYIIALDFTKVEYLSSAGIRLLVSQYKSLRAVNGIFYLAAVSDAVEQILKMVGMSDMLIGKPIVTKPAMSVNFKAEQFTYDNYKFTVTPIHATSPMQAEFYGTPEKILGDGFALSDMRTVQACKGHYALGLGAIGDTYEACNKRFGEFVMFDGNIAYLPADGSKKPDYMMNSGKLIGSLSELYGLHFTGDFTHLIRFEGESSKKTLGISQLTESIMQLTAYKEFVMVMIAEINGLVGISLNQIPSESKKIFNFPEIKDSVNFTTEPEHNKMLGVSLGFFSKDTDEGKKRFNRPITPDTSTLSHVHTAVFPYVPLKKTNIDLHETIDSLFDSGTLKDILHLVYDSRDIVGLGESQFIHGFCWVAPVTSIQLNSIK